MNQHVAHQFCLHSSELLDQAMLKVQHCLQQLEEEQVWWRPKPEINSVGNLSLHLCGNLRQWGIVPFTDQQDNRDREAEFSKDTRVAKVGLLRDLESTVLESQKLWMQLDEAELLKRIVIQGFEVNLMQAISHTSSHFVGHAHQIIMLTRMQLGDDYQFQWSPDADRGQVPI